jgi:hypothetical protein
LAAVPDPSSSTPTVAPRPITPVVRRCSSPLMTRMSAVAPATSGPAGLSWVEVAVAVTSGSWSAAIEADSVPSAGGVGARSPSVDGPICR